MKTAKKVTPRFKNKRPTQEKSVHCYNDMDSQKELRSSELDVARLQQEKPGCAESYRPAFDDARFVSTSSKDEEKSDRLIENELHDKLNLEIEINTADVEVMVVNGEVTLRGEVQSRKMKRFIEEQVARCAGVKDIHNDLHFKRK
ncbi:BON domain-containing protein [Bdellovibrio sp.]|uniref:BON domain-containing protein n=1 Tax=Bdellovibrio sp. TaxID=28201 RepID=UPI003221F207